MQGAKARSLSALAAEASTPPFAVLESRFFREFITHTRVGELLGEYAGAVGAEVPAESLDNARSVLIRAFLSLPWPREVSAAIADVYHQVAGGGIAGSGMVARSSASVEDGQRHSWAGQFVSVFGVHSLRDWERAVRAAWSRLGSAALARYAQSAGVRLDEIEVAVILQQAIDSVVSGVVAWEPARGEAMIEATWGLGGPLVGGLVTPERWFCETWVCNGVNQRVQPRGEGPVWRLGRNRLNVPGISEWLQGPGGGRVELRGTGGLAPAGVWVADPLQSPEHPTAVLDDATAGALAQFIATRGGMAAVECEWAADEQGRLWWLQERPLTTPLPGLSTTPSSTTPSSMAIPSGILASGTVGCPGVARGPGWWADGADAPQSRAILFKRTTAPEDLPILLDAAGVVTQDGGVLSHTAIVCRELQIPCVIGAFPFPPELDVSGDLLLDANEGNVRRAGDSVAAVCPMVAVFAPPAPRQDVGGVRYWMPAGLRSNVPASLEERLHRVATHPGVLNGVDVLPDLRPMDEHLGFPIGIAFESERFHPTAVTDCGDGFRIAAVSGVTARDIEGKPALLESLQEELSGDTSSSRRIAASLNIDDLFAAGLAGLERTRWRDAHPSRVEHVGRVEGADPSAIPAPIRELAQRCLTWHGQAGHFIEVLALCDHADTTELTGDEPIVVMLHTGSIEVGLEFLRWAVFTGASAAIHEGLDSPDSVDDGLWGVDITRPVGRRLLAGALGFVNYSFARRAVLQHLAQLAFQSAFGADCQLTLLSDIMHTGVSVQGDGLLHQHGVQRLMPVTARVPLGIAGAPGVASYLLEPSGDAPTPWCSHGKAELGDAAQFIREAAKGIASRCAVTGSHRTDPVVADAQTREAVAAMEGLGCTRAARALLPIFSLRGNLNGCRKLAS